VHLPALFVYAITAILAMGVRFAGERGKGRVSHKYIVHKASLMKAQTGKVGNCNNG
jgi:hypothetical protein